MLIVKSESNDAYFNMALEEYLLDKFDEEVFVTAISEPSIIVGVNQNSYQQVNALYVRQNNIKVVRRLSGGGTVFQDNGNINFSYIYDDDGAKITDFNKVCSIILKFIKEKLNLEAEFAGRNDLLIEGKKFSGHARLKKDNKILHHGTMLVSSNMKSLIDALKFDHEKYADRALSSNYERVTNLSEHLEEKMTTEKVFDLFTNFLRSLFPDANVYELNKEDIDAIEKLVSKKYSTWDWNYGHEVDIPYYKTCTFKKGNVELFVDKEDSYIKEVRIFGDFFSQKPVSELEEALKGCEMSDKSIRKALVEIDFNSYLAGVSIDEFIKSFLS